MTTAINYSELKNQIEAIALTVKAGATLAETEKRVIKEFGGDVFRFHRQAIMLELTTQRLGIAACGAKAVAKKIFELNQINEQDDNLDLGETIEATEVIEAEEIITAEPVTEKEVQPTPSKAIKPFKPTTIGDGLKVAYRADLTEQMAAVTTPNDFEDFFKSLPDTCGLVSRTAPYFTREWTHRIISADEKTKLSLNKVIESFDVLVDGALDQTLTLSLRNCKTINEVESLMVINDASITNGKKTFPTEGVKYGIQLICHMPSKTRLKTLATDFAIVELV